MPCPFLETPTTARKRYNRFKECQIPVKCRINYAKTSLINAPKEVYYVMVQFNEALHDVVWFFLQGDLWHSNFSPNMVKVPTDQ